MLHPILVTAEKSPLLTAAEVMKHRNEKRPLTPDFAAAYWRRPAIRALLQNCCSG